MSSKYPGHRWVPELVINKVVTVFFVCSNGCPLIFQELMDRFASNFDQGIALKPQ